MPISGLAVTLHRDAAERQEAIAALAEHPAIELGTPVGNRLPIVVETPDTEQDRAIWQWLHELAGVTFVDVVFVHFDECSENPPHRDDVREPSP